MEELRNNLKDASPLQLFEEFFDNDVYEMIETETIRYATTQKNKQGFTMTQDNIKIFIGFLIFSGYHSLPSERDYWSEDEDLGVAIVRNAMSRNAYLELKSVIHFQDTIPSQKLIYSWILV